MSENTLRKFLIASCGVIFGALAFSVPCSVKATASGSSDAQTPLLFE